MHEEGGGRWAGSKKLVELKKKKKEIVHSGGGAEVREGADTGNIIQVDFLEELAKE